MANELRSAFDDFLQRLRSQAVQSPAPAPTTAPTAAAAAPPVSKSEKDSEGAAPGPVAGPESRPASRPGVLRGAHFKREAHKEPFQVSLVNESLRRAGE